MNCVFCNCGKEEVAFDVEKPKCGIRNFKVSLVEYQEGLWEAVEPAIK